MAENKTKPTSGDVSAFIASVENSRRRADSETMLSLMSRVTGMEPVLWGDSLIGYGQYFYKYKSGHSGNFPLTGFSPRKAATTVYVMPGFKQYDDQLSRLGKHKHSVSCLYLTRLDRIDLRALEEIISDSVTRMKEIYPQWLDWPECLPKR
ncbi:MAG: DUF1801 domain-containing protein [Pseudomonadota bacterium]